MKLFALIQEGNAETSKLLVRIVGTFDGALQDGENFTTFETLKEMLPSFAKALKAGENVVLALDKAEYHKVRQKLCAALSLETEQNAELTRRLQEESDLTYAEKQVCASMPKGATVFPTHNGEYAGFLVEKGKQCIFFFPLEDQSLKEILKQGVAPLLTQRALFGNSAPQTPCIPEEEPQTQEETVLTEDEIGAAAFTEDADILQKTVNLLRENGQKVAISGTPGADAVKTLAESNPTAADYILFTPHVEDKGDYNLTDYAALLAKSAKELTGSALGASISEIGTGDGGDFICITVADDETALVRKLYREPDESSADFCQDAAEELIELIFEKASGKKAVGLEVANAASAQEKKPFFQTVGGKVLISILVILLVAALAVGSVFAIRYKKKQEQAKIASQTVAPPVTTEAPKIEAPAADMIPFSQMMYREMINGVQETPAETAKQTNDGTAIDTTGSKPSADIPSEMMVNGITMDAKEAVARIVEAEMGNTYREEALKAQAVCVYTYLKYRNTNWKITGVTLAETYSDEVYNAVRSVFGEYLSFEDKPAFTPYFKLSAGKTSAAEAVFKKSFPYLTSVDSLSDKADENYESELIFAADDVRAMLTAYDSKLTVPEDPKEWFKITKHNGAVNTGAGYVETVSVCGKEISGWEFVNTLFAGKNIPSSCFEIGYNKTTNEFKITAYGIGDGVGMSQNGANKMAATGSNYVQILSKFFPGTKISV